MIWKNLATGQIVPVPLHNGSKPIPIGTFLAIIKQARKLELSGKDEYKTSFRIFEAQVKAAGLEIVKDILVWGISQNGMGSHVIILKAPR